MRAEQACGELSPEASWTLSASEIGAYAFCPQAWLLQRCRLPVTAETEGRRRAGSKTHREIGRQTDLVRTAGAPQTMVLIAAGAVLLVRVAVQSRLGAVASVRPSTGMPRQPARSQRPRTTSIPARTSARW